jgi:hypothetical protein
MSKRIARTIVLRIEELQVAELIALNPDLLDPIGGIKYGGWQRYFLSLMRQDLERRKILLMGQVNATS